MPGSGSTEIVDSETKHEHSPRKRIRHRKKQLYENILKQMEFYFSDANLTKDRFLGDLVKREPYISLETFLKFNKIRSLTQDVNDIAKAMKHSTLLELSEDKSKIKRKTPLQPYNADIRTVYVESIPVTTSREWVERVFSDYGPVAYISLPKFKNSQRIKGYAFIEFTNPEDAQKCLNTFTKMGCKLPTCMPPEELSSIKMFSIEEPEDIPAKQEEKEVYEPPKKKKKKEKRPQKGLELKLGQDSDSDKKVETPSEESKNITTPSEELNTPDIESKDELTSQDEAKDGQGTPRKKKSRKRTKDKTKTGLGKNEAPKDALWGLQVLPKSEWKALRNKYLNLQRKYMKDMKNELHNKRYQYPSSIPALAASSVGVGTAIPSSETVDAKSEIKLERIPGVFVKEILPEPCLDVRLTKRTQPKVTLIRFHRSTSIWGIQLADDLGINSIQIRSNVHALHVDVKEGHTEVIIRFDASNAASEYCNNSVNPARVLSASEETEQWERADAARASRRPRGRCKLLALRDRAAPSAPPAPPLAHLAPPPAHLAPPPAHPRAPASPQPTHTHIRFDDE